MFKKLVLCMAYVIICFTYSPLSFAQEQSRSDWQLIITGVSYHIGAREYTDKDTRQRKDFNEVNLGLGIQKNFTNHVSVAVGAYRNSYRETSIYGYASLESSPLTDLGKVTVGIDAGLISGYDDYIDDRVIIGNTGLAMIASPFVSVDISGISGDILPSGTNLKANIIPGDGLLGSDNNNSVDAAVGLSLRVPLSF